MFNRSRVLVIVVLTLLLTFLFGFGIAFAQGADPPAPTPVPSLVEFLKLLASGVIVGPAIAFLFERFKWFQNLSSDGRFWVVFALSIGLPMLGTVLLQFVPANVWATLEPFWAALATGVMIWVGSQLAHRFEQKRAA
jgi:hypothetical protein